MCNWLLAPLIDFICLFVLIICLLMPDQNFMSRYSEINVMITLTYIVICTGNELRNQRGKRKRKSICNYINGAGPAPPRRWAPCNAPCDMLGAEAAHQISIYPKKKKDNLATCQIFLTAYRRNIALPYLQIVSSTAILYLEETPVRNDCNCTLATVCF